MNPRLATWRVYRQRGTKGHSPLPSVALGEPRMPIWVTRIAGPSSVVQIVQVLN